MKALHDLKKMLEKEIEKVTSKNEIAPAEIEALYKVIDIIKDIDTIKAMEEYGEEYDDEYSERGYSRRGYSRRGSYENSYRRGRDSRTGRYVSRDNGAYRGSYRGYSRDDAKEDMLEKLEEAMEYFNLELSEGA